MNLTRKVVRAALVVVCVAAFSGCAMQRIHTQVHSGYQQGTASMQPYLHQVTHANASMKTGPIISNLPYVSTTVVVHSPSLPPVFSEHVAIRRQGGTTIAGLLQQVSALSGVTIRGGRAVVDVGGAVPPTKSAASSPRTDSAQLRLPPSIIGAQGGSMGAAPALLTHSIHYDGDLQGLFNRIAAQVDAAWKYQAATNTVQFLRYETKVFTLATTPGDASTKDTIGGAQQTVTGQQGQTLRVSGASATTTYSNKLNVWKSVTAAVKSLLSPTGHLVASPATGTLTVTDRYNRVANVANYIHQINAHLGLSVAVTVTAYRVDVNNNDQHGVDWSLMYNTLQRLAGKVGVTIATPGGAITNANQVIISVPKTTHNGTTPSLWGKSSFMFQALSALGHTSVIQHATVVTTNDQPAPIAVVESQSYLAETTSLFTNGTSATNAINGVVGAGATLTPGNVETGFKMQVLPSVQPDGQHMLLQLTISSSVLNSLTTASSGGNSIELPDVTSRQTMQRAWISSGQTLVLAGFESSTNSNTTNTLLGKHTWFFGGNRALNHSRRAVVFVITPVVTDHGTSVASVSTTGHHA